MATPKLENTEMTVGQSGGEVLFNEALRNLDVAIFPVIKEMDLTAPPGSPATGDAYIPAATATGDWVGKENDIAYYDNGWKFITMDAGLEGAVVYVQDIDFLKMWNGTSWINQPIPVMNVEAKTANFDIESTDNGKTFTNAGASGIITGTLPVAAAGLHYFFVVEAAFSLRIDPDGTETISNAAATPVTGGAGKYLGSAGVIGESIHVVCTVNGIWHVIGNVGTWTLEA